MKQFLLQNSIIALLILAVIVLLVILAKAWPRRGAKKKAAEKKHWYQGIHDFFARLPALITSDKQQQDAYTRFIPIFALFFGASVVVWNWGKRHALNNNSEYIPWIFGVGVFFVLGQFAWWFLARPFGFKKAATYWPLATACIVFAIGVVVFFNQREVARVNFYAGAESDSTAVIKSFCRYNGTSLHQPSGRVVIYTGDKMLRYRHCEICFAEMVPLTPEIARIELIRASDPDHLPAEFGLLADSLSGYRQADSSVTDDNTPAVESEGDTTSVIPYQDSSPERSGMTTGTLEASPPWQEPIEPSPVEVVKAQTRHWGFTQMLGAAILVMILVIALTKGRRRMVLIGAVVFLFMLTVFIVNGARADPVTTPLPFEQPTHSSEETLFRWLVSFPVNALVILLALLLGTVTIWGTSQRKYFFLGLSTLIALLMIGVSFKNPWTADAATSWRYDAFPWVVTGVAGLFFLAFARRASHHHAMGTLHLIFTFIVMISVLSLIWVPLGVQPYRVAPNQHTQVLIPSTHSGVETTSDAAPLAVGLNVLNDQRVGQIPAGSRVRIVYLEDYDKGIRHCGPKGVATARAYYGSEWVNKANRTHMAQQPLFANVDADMIRVFDQKKYPRYWPVMMIDRGTVFKNPETKWIGLEQGQSYDVLEGGELVFGLNIAENCEKIERDSEHMGEWTVYYVIERSTSSSLTNIGLTQ